MDLILFGPPGAGKGTQAKQLSLRLSLRHVSTGDVLRTAIRDRSALGVEAERFMKQGQLVPDDLVTRMLAEEISSSSSRSGTLLDGYPRTVEQSKDLDVILRGENRKIDAVVFLDVATDILVARLSGRRSCPQCAAMYHLTSKPPATEGYCDVCGHELVTRSDDNHDVVVERLSVYEMHTKPLLAVYRERKLLRAVDGAGSVEQVQKRILAELGEAS